jgi:hypothetical protein
MNLQELAYLEVYNHVYQEIKKKEEAQMKIRRWWCFVFFPKEVAIVRTQQCNSFTYNLKSIVYVTESHLNITGLNMERELFITFSSNRQIRLYLLKLILRAKYVFKIQIKEAIGQISDGLCFQLLE